MRRDFVKILLKEMSSERGKDIIVISADMGYGLFDDIRSSYPDRFHNVGSAEQLMLGVAAGLAMDKKIPVCYSITPFLLYRPFEFIRNFMNIERLPIKLAGGGRNKDYGYLGFTHWAEEDLDIMGQLKNIKCYKPENVEEMSKISLAFIYDNSPSYLNLIK